MNIFFTMISIGLIYNLISFLLFYILFYFLLRECSFLKICLAFILFRIILTSDINQILFLLAITILSYLNYNKFNMKIIINCLFYTFIYFILYKIKYFFYTKKSIIDYPNLNDYNIKLI
jgi:hypothetical protein